MHAKIVLIPVEHDINYFFTTSTRHINPARYDRLFFLILKVSPVCRTFTSRGCNQRARPMNPERWQFIEDCFHQALELEGPAQQAWLDELEKSNPEEAWQVRELLLAHQSSGSFLDNDSIFHQATQAGRQIGAWKIIRQIGEGGMSTVYLAERADGQFERQVAIKFLHGIMPGRERHQRILKEQNRHQ